MCKGFSLEWVAHEDILLGRAHLQTVLGRYPLGVIPLTCLQGGREGNEVLIGEGKGGLR